LVKEALTEEVQLVLAGMFPNALFAILSDDEKGDELGDEELFFRG
jgi:hypothetical protein